MNRTNALLNRLGLYGTRARCYRAILEIGLEYRGLPTGIYGKAAQRIGSTEAAVQRIISLSSRPLWEYGRSLGLWPDRNAFVSPKLFLSDMLCELTGGKYL